MAKYGDGELVNLEIDWALTWTCFFHAITTDSNADAREGLAGITMDLPPSELVRELKLYMSNHAEKETDQRAVIDEQCPNCKHNKLSYSTAQLRSADEGQTIFYQCLKCKFRFTVNS